uniref:Uncharacterized protein n=1 Tax=Arundo donax TaxID=35708 RepID=A0A0A9DUP5_ARUDO
MNFLLHCVTRIPVSKTFCRVRHPASVSDSDTRVRF